MNIKLTSLCASLVLAATACLHAGEANPFGQAKPGSPELERLKTLVGNWTGKVDMGQGPVEMNIEFRLVAGGTVLEERSAPGTPMEMVTMFYDKGGKLSATHYCILGNRLEMALKASDAKSITLDFDSCCGIDTKKESHMHGMTLSFDDANTISTSCKAIMNGQEMADHASTFKRVTTAAK